MALAQLTSLLLIQQIVVAQGFGLVLPLAIELLSKHEFLVLVQRHLSLTCSAPKDRVRFRLGLLLVA